MTDLLLESEASRVFAALSYLSPGFLIYYFRSRFLTGRSSRFSEVAIELAVVSSIYFASFGNVFLFFGWSGALSSFFLLFVVPVLIGAGLGVSSRSQWFDKLFERLRLNPIHPAVTGWDYMFGTMKKSQWVIIRLTDGRMIHGYFSRDSGASSDLSCRDIFVSDVRKGDFSKFEEDGRSRGMWIREDFIQSIEIIPEEE